MSPKIKIEDTLPSGGKITIVIEDRNISEEKVIKILHFIKSLSQGNILEEDVEVPNKSDFKISDIIWEIIFNKFGNGTWFTSKDVYRALLEEGYEVNYRAVSTYLLRFYRRGMLIRAGSRGNLKYRIRTPILKT